MSRTNQNEITQNKTNPATGRISRVVLPVVLFAFLAMVCLFLNIYDISPSGEAALPQNMAYISGESLEAVKASPSSMNPISYFYQIQSSGEYTHIYFTMDASDVKRKLYIYSFFSQYKLIVNDSEVVDEINTAEPFSDNSRNLVTISPSAETITVNIIFKNSFSANYKVYILPENYSVFALLMDTMAFIVWPVFFAFFVLVSLLKMKKAPFVKTDLIAYLFCIGITVSIYALYLPNFQQSVTKLGFLFAAFSGILWINCLLTQLKTKDSIRQTLIGTGILFCAVILPDITLAFTVVLYQWFGLYFLICFITILFFSIKNSDIQITIVNTYYSLFCVCFMVQWLYSIINIKVDHLYLQMLFPIVGGIFSLTGYMMGDTEQFTNNKKIQDQLLIFKPTDIGRFQDLLDIFLQEKEYLEHSRNVSLYVYEICKGTDITSDQAKVIAQAAFLHDIGKMMLSKSMFFKSENLSKDEYEQIKIHTKYGSDLFSNSSDDMLNIASIIAMQHHERFDGNGYYGLKENEINCYAQIVSIADVFDAATTRRTYKKPWTFDEGIDYIKIHSGTLFNPEFVKAFLDSKENIYTIYCQIKA